MTSGEYAGMVYHNHRSARRLAFVRQFSTNRSGAGGLQRVVLFPRNARRAGLDVSDRLSVVHQGQAIRLAVAPLSFK